VCADAIGSTETFADCSPQLKILLPYVAMLVTPPHVASVLRAMICIFCFGAKGWCGRLTCGRVEVGVLESDAGFGGERQLCGLGWVRANPMAEFRDRTYPGMEL